MLFKHRRPNRVCSSYRTISYFLLIIFLAGRPISSSDISHATSPSSGITGAAGAIDTVRQITLPTKDLVYDPVNQRIYASVPSSAGSNGNSLTQIDPVAGSIGNSVFIGSEPGK
jgi:hypothetical protein